MDFIILEILLLEVVVVAQVLQGAQDKDLLDLLVVLD